MKRYWKAFVRRLPISWGKRRIVFTIVSLGVVVKVPRLRLHRLWEFWRADVVLMKMEMLSSPLPEPKTKELYWEGVRLALRRTLRQTFGGIGDNWRERSFYKYSDATTRQLLKPTLFSFFGLLNIQLLGEPCKDTAACGAFRLIAGSELSNDGHHWDHPSNFDLSSGRPQLLYYGSKATQTIIKKFGARFLTEFDLEAGRAQEAREQAYFDSITEG